MDRVHVPVALIMQLGPCIAGDGSSGDILLAPSAIPHCSELIYSHQEVIHPIMLPSADELALASSRISQIRASEIKAAAAEKFDLFSGVKLSAAGGGFKAARGRNSAFQAAGRIITPEQQGKQMKSRLVGGARRTEQRVCAQMEQVAADPAAVHPASISDDDRVRAIACSDTLHDIRCAVVFSQLFENKSKSQVLICNHFCFFNDNLVRRARRLVHAVRVASTLPSSGKIACMLFLLGDIFLSELLLWDCHSCPPAMPLTASSASSAAENVAKVTFLNEDDQGYNL
jgi:hypothetical protein